MCFNYSNSKRASDIARRYNRKTDIVEAWREIMEEEKRNDKYKVNFLAEQQYNISGWSKPPCMIITDSEQIQVMNWGLRSKTMRLKDVQKYDKENWFVNAHGDRIHKTFPYEYLIGKQRCIIPVTGFIEPHYPSPKSRSEAWYIHLRSQEIFSVAGLWDKWIHPETNEVRDTFAMITSDANGKLRFVHNGGSNPFNMPLILHPEDEQNWLNLDTPIEDIDKLIKPFPDTDIETFKIDDSYWAFNRKNPFDINILNKID